MVNKGKYSLDEAVKILECTPLELLKYGANNSLKMAVYLKWGGKAIYTYQDDQQKNEPAYTGFYYLLPDDIAKLANGYIEFTTTQVIPTGNKLPTYKGFTGCYEGAIEGQDTYPYQLVEQGQLVNITPEKIQIFPSDLTEFKDAFFKKERKQLKENEKSINSLLKIILAMAVGGYSYNPEDKKSKVTQEIVEDAQRAGIDIDADTVRKWLKASAKRFGNDLPDSSGD